MALPQSFIATLVCHSQIMKASIAQKNKFCLQVLPIKSSVSLDLERRSLSTCPEHIPQSAHLNVSAPLIFYTPGFNFYIYIIVSIILCSPVLPHPHHFPYKLSMARWTWLNRMKQLEGEKVPKSQPARMHQKNSQRTNKCKGTLCFRTSGGYMPLQPRKALGDHIAQCFLCSHPPPLR